MKPNCSERLHKSNIYTLRYSRCSSKTVWHFVNKHKEDDEEDAQHAVVGFMTSDCSTWLEPRRADERQTIYIIHL